MEGMAWHDKAWLGKRRQDDEYHSMLHLIACTGTRSVTLALKNRRDNSSVLVSTDVLSVYVYVGLKIKDTVEENKIKQRIMGYEVS